MALFEWEPRFDLHIESMDGEHKTLVRLMNQLHELHASNAAGAAVRAGLRELEAFTVKHFADEEEYMGKLAFPGLAVHKRMHRDLLQGFGQHKEKMLAGGRDAAEAFFAFLRLWLAAHIAGIDQKYAAHARDLVANHG